MYYVIGVNHESGAVRVYDKATDKTSIYPKKLLVDETKLGKIKINGLKLDSLGRARFKCYTRQEIFGNNKKADANNNKLKEDLLSAIGDRINYPGVSEDIHVNRVCNLANFFSSDILRKTSELKVHTDLCGYCGIGWTTKLANDIPGNVFVGSFMPVVPRSVICNSQISDILVHITINNVSIYKGFIYIASKNKFTDLNELIGALKWVVSVPRRDTPNNAPIADLSEFVHGISTLPYRPRGCDFDIMEQACYGIGYYYNRDLIDYVVSLIYGGVPVDMKSTTMVHSYCPQLYFTIDNGKIKCKLTHLAEPRLLFDRSTSTQAESLWDVLVIVYEADGTTKHTTAALRPMDSRAIAVADAHNSLVRALGYKTMESKYRGSIDAPQNYYDIATGIGISSESLELYSIKLHLMNLYIELCGLPAEQTNCKCTAYGLSWEDGNLAINLVKAGKGMYNILVSYKDTPNTPIAVIKFDYEKHAIRTSTYGKLSDKPILKIKHKIETLRLEERNYSKSDLLLDIGTDRVDFLHFDRTAFSTELTKFAASVGRKSKQDVNDNSMIADWIASYLKISKLATIQLPITAYMNKSEFGVQFKADVVNREGSKCYILFDISTEVDTDGKSRRNYKLSIATPPEYSSKKVCNIPDKDKLNHIQQLIVILAQYGYFVGSDLPAEWCGLRDIKNYLTSKGIVPTNVAIKSLGKLPLVEHLNDKFGIVINKDKTLFELLIALTTIYSNYDLYKYLVISVRDNDSVDSGTDIKYCIDLLLKSGLACDRLKELVSTFPEVTSIGLHARDVALISDTPLLAYIASVQSTSDYYGALMTINTIYTLFICVVNKQGIEVFETCIRRMGLTKLYDELMDLGMLA